MSLYNAVKEVTPVINDKLKRLIGWPSTQQERERIPLNFRAIAGLDNICGVIDGTHVDIATPTVDEPQFVNRHHRHSLNVMAICGPAMDFYYINARFPGSVNDCRVLRNSTIFQFFENGWRPFNNAIIIGQNFRS